MLEETPWDNTLASRNAALTAATNALRWYSSAARQGFATSQYVVGQCNELGVGTDRDIEKAINAYTDAAKKGHNKSIAALKRLGHKPPVPKHDKPQIPKDAEVHFRTACKIAIADGKLTDEEQQQLRNLAKSLNIPREVWRRVYNEEKDTFLRDRKKQ